MKVGDLVMNKAYQNSSLSGIVPARLVLQVTAKVNHALSEKNGPYLVLSNNPEVWVPSGSFFVVSPA
jgi:hypothetical protein